MRLVIQVVLSFHIFLISGDVAKALVTAETGAAKMWFMAVSASVALCSEQLTQGNSLSDRESRIIQCAERCSTGLPT